jgi:hypothetical protein
MACLSPHDTDGVAKLGRFVSCTSATPHYNAVTIAIHVRFPIKGWPPDNNPSFSKFPTSRMDSIYSKNQKFDQEPLACEHIKGAHGPHPSSFKKTMIVQPRHQKRRDQTSCDYPSANSATKYYISRITLASPAAVVLAIHPNALTSSPWNLRVADGVFHHSMVENIGFVQMPSMMPATG